MCQMLNALIEMKSGQLNKELPRKRGVENCLKGKLQKKKKRDSAFLSGDEFVDPLTPKHLGKAIFWTNLNISFFFFFSFLPPTASSCIQHAKEVCPC